MKTSPPILALAALFSACSGVLAAPVLVPNGDFETPSGATWTEGSGGGTYAFSYPSTEGNPNGYGVIDHTADDGGFGIWIANDNAEVALATLGLTAGETYVFTQDMKILAGSKIGGFKVDFFVGGEISGSTGDLFPVRIGDGSNWETYSFRVTIPAGTEGIKVVPLWGAGSSIGYDNVGVDNAPVATPLLPNGDFEGGSASWFEIGAPNTTYSYPSSGGNPTGYGVMTNDGGGFGIWVANGGAPLSLAALGISGGDTVTFKQDMKIFSGANIGGLKVEFFAGTTFLSDTGDMTPALIEDGSTWETYSFEVPIRADADFIKLVPLWGPGSSVGYDNFTFSVAPPQPFAVDFRLGTAVSWAAPSGINLYQPQMSDDGVDWLNLGPALVGNAITSAFDQDRAPFYRVLETPVFVLNSAVNGGFETPDPIDAMLANAWSSIGSQPPTRTTADPRSGTAAMRLKVLNDGTPTPNTSEIQQNVANAGGSITPGDTYDFSFWAKQVTSGVSYVQQYRAQWLDAGGAILPGGVEFKSFAGGTGEWVEITAPGLVAPDGAATALIQIFGATGAVAGGTAQGEVLIDDLSLVGSSASPPVIETVLNGNFEFLDFNDPDCSESWICAGTQPPINVISDSRSGIAAMEFKVQNNGTATPNSSEINQNIFDAGGSITPGRNYDFSFWAKQVSSGVSYVQQYRLQWLDGVGAILPGGLGFTDFTGGSGEWAEITAASLEAPAGAVTAFIEIVASTGAVAGVAAKGEVFMDDVSLAESNQPDILAASAGTGLAIFWNAKSGKEYQVKCSADLTGFVDFGPLMVGDDGQMTLTDLLTLPAKFYRVVETTP